MASDKVIGGLLFIVSLVIIIVYGWLVFFTGYALLLLKITGFVAVAGVFGVLAWIGYTLATTPPPKPIEEIEKELEEELKKLEGEMKKEEISSQGEVKEPEEEPS